MNSMTSRELLADLVRQVCESKQRIEQEQQTIDELKRIAKTEFKVSPKDFSQYVDEWVRKAQ